MQTFKTNQIDIQKFYSISTILNLYPNFVYTFYSDARSIEYFKQKDKRLIAYFNKLKPGAYKADLWRYCILYKKGGIYLDIKYKCLSHFKLIE